MIYTIGHGNRKIDNFISNLKQYNIECIVDVRPLPYSDSSPQYNRLEFEKILLKHKFKYVYLGENLGGLPKSQSTYYKDGRVITKY